MKLRILLGTLLAFVGLVTFTQVNAQGLGCRWGGSGWCPGAWGGSGPGYSYRYNFGGCGGCGAFVGLGYVGCGYGGYVTTGAPGYGYGGTGYSGYRASGPFTYGQGRCGFALSPSAAKGVYPSTWKGYSPDVYAVNCQMGICATGALAESSPSDPEVAQSAPEDHNGQLHAAR